MASASPSSSRYDDPAQKPLFGEPKSRDRVANLVVGVLTSIAVLVTLISAFIFPQWPPNGVNVFFAIVIVFICGSHLLLIFWYRQGDLEPKFRTMIFYNAFTIVLLCVCGNLYIHAVGGSTGGKGGNSTKP
ncbi:transmembrane protein 243-like [Liolophura sinensis]|uniref:transmembrane protein 243-like n=1 Tax=Liolophura sinensis TaxID=3198878 RepID=UPI003158B63B